MSLKSIVLKQYRDIVNNAASSLKTTTVPPEGWLYTLRTALSMPVSHLAKRLDKTRAHIYHTEKAEIEGKVTLKTMDNMAKAMNCRFIYAIVPNDSVESIIEARAKKIAKRLVRQTNQHMALEQQALTEEQITFEINRMTRAILNDLPSNFWVDDE